MKKLSILMGLLLILTVGVLPATAITWGELDGKGHPNVGLISRPDPNNPDAQRPFCSGTLIHSRVFLTAGHCTDYLEYLMAAGRLTIEGVKVSFDADNALEKKLLAVEEVITHPDYNWTYSNSYDVGVLILKKPVKRLPLATLPEEGFLDRLLAEGKLRQGSDGAKFTVVGYGSTLEWPPPDIIFPDGKRRVAESEYQTLLKAWLRMSQNQATDDGGTCYGDSGGPAFWTEPDGTEILVGVTSWGDMQCVATGFNYRVDIPETVDYLDDVIAGLE
jgi:secreted trypsin-like serine protease